MRGMGFAHVSIFRPGLLDRGAARRRAERLLSEIVCTCTVTHTVFLQIYIYNHVNCTLCFYIPVPGYHTKSVPLYYACTCPGVVFVCLDYETVT